MIWYSKSKFSLRLVSTLKALVMNYKRKPDFPTFPDKSEQCLEGIISKMLELMTPAEQALLHTNILYTGSHPKNESQWLDSLDHHHANILSRP